MKGVILAGGTGSRLRPITYIVNKNLLPVYNKPAIIYNIDLLKKAGISEIAIVAEHNFISDFKYLLGNGVDYDVKISYINDSPLKKGPGSAVNCARDFIGSSNFVLVFADNIFDTCIKKEVEQFTDGAILFVKEVNNPSSFGVVQTNKKGKVISIEEKPVNPKSKLVSTGLQIYDNNILEMLKRQKPGLNGEYLLVDINQEYLKRKKLQAIKMDGFWQDMGTFDGLYIASNYYYNKTKGNKKSKILQKKTLNTRQSA